LLEIGFTYDVVCSYIKRILERFKDYHPDLLPVVERIKMLLPKLHIHGHKELCQAVYAIPYAEGFGHTHGEGIESFWGDHNDAGRPTREMTSGARQDWLVGVFNFSNWRKTEQMRKCSDCVFAPSLISS
ncbi:hypothetical protein K466DRAFT_502263, partial [Polyporus arcularius HHB13444]